MYKYYRGNTLYIFTQWYARIDGVDEWTVLQATEPRTHTIVRNRYKLKFDKNTFRVLATDLKTGDEFYLAQLHTI